LRNTLNRRKKFFIIRAYPFDFFFKLIFKIGKFGFKEKEFFNIKNKGFSITFVMNSCRVFSKVIDLFRGKGWISTFGGFIKDRRYIFERGFRDGFSRREGEKDIEEDFRKDIEVFFSFREKNGQAVKDLSFGLRDFMFDLAYGSCDDFSRCRDLGGFKEFSVFEGKESDGIGILSIGFRRVSRADKLMESVGIFGINDKRNEVVINEEGDKRDMVACRGFYKDYGIGERRNNRKKVLKTFRGLRKGAFFEDLGFFIDDAEVEGIFGDVNPYIVLSHGHPPLEKFFGIHKVPCSNLPRGRGFRTQPTYWELRDRGTDSFWGFRAHKKWSSCPLDFKTLQSMHDYIIN
jgi:hypothetical protein